MEYTLATCPIFRRHLIRPSRSFSIETAELEVLSGPHGVRRVVERGSRNYSDFHVLGGWMEHSLFASRVSLFTNEMGIIYLTSRRTLAIMIA